MEKHIFRNKELLCEALANWIEDRIHEVLETSDRFTFALSGGSTPKLLYEQLATKKSIPWDKIHFFWGDERVVPFSDSRNNAGMSFKELLDKVPVVRSQIHIIPTDIDINAAVESYDKVLKNYFSGYPSFDLVLLGMGEDGHTLSLFPDGELLTDNSSWVRSVIKKGEEISRITLMPSLVNKSRYIVFLISGNDKAPMLKNVLESDPYYPANLIQPESKELHWFLDENASALLKDK